MGNALKEVQTRVQVAKYLPNWNQNNIFFRSATFIINLYKTLFNLLFRCRHFEKTRGRDEKIIESVITIIHALQLPPIL